MTFSPPPHHPLLTPPLTSCRRWICSLQVSKSLSPGTTIRPRGIAADTEEQDRRSDAAGPASAHITGSHSQTFAYSWGHFENDTICVEDRLSECMIHWASSVHMSPEPYPRARLNIWSWPSGSSSVSLFPRLDAHSANTTQRFWLYITQLTVLEEKLLNSHTHIWSTWYIWTSDLSKRLKYIHVLGTL